jgi:tetratricopeptide (TPR) repeat protein
MHQVLTLLISLVFVNARAIAVPLPHTYPLTPAEKTDNPFDPLLQDWLDEHSGISAPELLTQEEFERLVAKSDAGVAMYLRLARNPRSVSANDVTAFLEKMDARVNVAEGMLIADSIYYELLKTNVLSTEVRSKINDRLTAAPSNSCVQKMRTLDEINNSTLTGMNDDEVRGLLARINEFRSQNFRKRALRQVIDSLPKARRDPLKETLVSHVSQHMSVLRSYDWLVEYYEQTDPSNQDQQHLAIDDIKRLASKKQCSKARTDFFDLLATKPKVEIMNDIVNAGKAVDTCYRGRDSSMRFKFWTAATVEMEKIWGFAGWAEGSLRSGYLHWAKNDMEDAKRIFSNVIVRAASNPEVRAKALYALARVNENENEYDLAAKSFEEYIESYPEAEHVNEAIESLVLIYSDKKDWQNALRPLEKLIKKQDLLEYDRRSVSSQSFAMFWAGRIYLETGKGNEAAEMFRRVASEYYSTFYGAMGHYMLEKLLDKKLVLEPQRTPSFSFAQLAKEFSPEDQVRLKRVTLMLRLGLRSDAMCELDEIDTDGGGPARMLTRSLILHVAGHWLDAIKVYDALPRTYRNTLAVGFERLLFPLRYGDTVKAHALKAELDPDLIFGIIRQESVFNPMARSPVGASGLMQLMPATAKVEASRLSQNYVDKNTKARIKREAQNKKNLLDPDTNLTLGIHHVRTLLAKYGNPVYILSAYNASPSAAERWMGKIPTHDLLTFIERIPYKETRAYVKLVLRNYFYYKRWYGSNADSLTHFDSVTFPVGTLAKLENKSDVEIEKTGMPNH